MNPKASPSTPRKAEATKEKILKAARALFVERGFEGTAMGQIATMAGVNHSLLFHHFGNKQNLWLAVKLSIVKESNALSSTLPSLDKPFDVFLKELVTNSISFYKNNPDIMRMINWQRLEHEKERLIGVGVSEESMRWINAFKHYQQKGEIDSSLKPEFIMTMILAIVSSAVLDPNVFIKKAEDNEAYINFCVERLLKALR